MKQHFDETSKYKSLIGTHTNTNTVCTVTQMEILYVPPTTLTNHTPLHLFTKSMLRDSQSTAADFFTDVDDFYGVDSEGRVSFESDDGVIVPVIEFSPNEMQLQGV